MTTPDPPLFVLWYDFTRWLLERTEKFPRKIRSTFRLRIDNMALDVLEGIVEARYSRDKAHILRRIDLKMEVLRLMLRMCHDMRHLDHKAYEHASRTINEAGKMVGGWRRQQSTRRP
jgi:23S rRNA-intervening sequence protein